MRRRRLVRVVAAGGDGRAVVAEAELGLGLVEAVHVEAVGVEIRDEVVGRAQEDDRLVARVGAYLKDALKDLQRGKDSRGVSVCGHISRASFPGGGAQHLNEHAPRQPDILMYAEAGMVVCKTRVISVTTVYVRF